jgi:hypothetical protein
MRGFLLFIIAIILYLPLTFLNWLMVCFKYGLKNDYFIQTAIHIDIFGNKNMRTLFNATLIKSNSPYKFGETDVTISAVLGYNQHYKYLTNTGSIVVWLLDKIEKKHCYKAALYYRLF